MGGIFILKRNLVISVALGVAWIFVTAFAIVGFYNQKRMVENIQYIETAKLELTEDKVEEVLEEERIEEVELPQDNKKEQTVATSRSGIGTSRDDLRIYYEDISIEVTEEEIDIFERIVEAEVSTNNYEGKLAVANVILNRVESEKFPNTIKEVVFAKRQFSPVSDGRYYKVKVSELTKQVVQDALNGYRVIGRDAYYFCTPTAPGKGWFETDLRKIDYIAPHNFYGYKN